MWLSIKASKSVSDTIRNYYESLLIIKYRLTHGSNYFGFIKNMPQRVVVL